MRVQSWAWSRDHPAAAARKKTEDIKKGAALSLKRSRERDSGSVMRWYMVASFYRRPCTLFRVSVFREQRFCTASLVPVIVRADPSLF